MKKFTIAHCFSEKKSSSVSPIKYINFEQYHFLQNKNCKKKSNADSYGIAQYCIIYM